jgi:hypothetical protein
VVWAVINGVQNRSPLGKLSLYVIVNSIQASLCQQTSGYPGLICDHNNLESRQTQSTNCRGGIRKQVEIFLSRDVTGFRVNDTVPINEYSIVQWTHQIIRPGQQVTCKFPDTYL